MDAAYCYKLDILEYDFDRSFLNKHKGYLSGFDFIWDLSYFILEISLKRLAYCDTDF